MPSWHIKITGVAPLIQAWEEGDDVKALGHDVSHILRTALSYEEGDDLALDEAIANIEEAATREEFDEAMVELYDWADKERVWIDPVN
jgi:hypothetical protein